MDTPTLGSINNTRKYTFVPAIPDAIKKPYTDMFQNGVSSATQVSGEDKVTLSPEVRKLSEYFETYGTIESGLKRGFLEDNFQENSKLVNERVNQIMQQAEKDGISLNRGMITGEVRRINRVFPPSNHEMDVLSPTGTLTASEREMFQGMHRYAKENGLDERYVARLAFSYAMEKLQADKGYRTEPSVDSVIKSEIHQMKTAKYGDLAGKLAYADALSYIADNFDISKVRSETLATKNDPTRKTSVELSTLLSRMVRENGDKREYSELQTALDQSSKQPQSMLTQPDKDSRYDWISEFTQRFDRAKSNGNESTIASNQRLLSLMEKIAVA